MIKAQKNNGFTLIELLVTVVIITILSSVILASMSDHRKKTRDARRVLELNQLKDAINLHFQENGTFPCNIYPERYIDPGTDMSHDCYGTDQYFIYKVFGGRMPFSSAESEDIMPFDPSNGDDYYYEKLRVNSGDPKGFCLGADVEYIVAQDNVCPTEIEGNYEIVGP